jgi:acetyl-CoA acetyltransferase
VDLKGRTAIIGYAETEFLKKPGDKTNVSEYAAASKLALDDAGLSKDDIDGLISLNPETEPMLTWAEDFTEYFQWHPKYLDAIYRGGGSGTAALLYGAMALEAGLCKNLLIVGGGIVDIKTFYEAAPEQSASPWWYDFDYIYGTMWNNSAYALIKQRYMYEFGAKDEQFAQVAVNAHNHSSMFPNSVFKNKLTVEDVVNSRMICDPLHLYEIVMPITGTLAMVMTSAENAKRSKNQPVYLLGGGQAFDRGINNPAFGFNPSLTTSPAKISSRQAYEMAGIGPRDIDIAELYDCYTTTVVIELEDTGFCEKGQGAKFVEKTDLSYAGDLPVNTDGGQLGRGQPSGAAGLMPPIEATRQLMRRAGPLQVNGAKYALVNSQGGSMADQCTLILSTEA